MNSLLVQLHILPHLQQQLQVVGVVSFVKGMQGVSMVLIVIH
jgi:hypothetical protein